MNLLEKASGATNLPIVDGSWDGPAARSSLAKWASSDGSGDRDKISWARYRRGFFWYDDKNPERLGSYKLPFATVRQGRLVAVRRGIFAAAAAVQGARGGVHIPSSEIPAVRARIASYYRRMGLTPPWKQRNEDEAVRALLESLELAEALIAYRLCHRLEAGRQEEARQMLSRVFEARGWKLPGDAL